MHAKKVTVFLMHHKKQNHVGSGSSFSQSRDKILCIKAACIAPYAYHLNVMAGLVSLYCSSIVNIPININSSFNNCTYRISTN